MSPIQTLMNRTWLRSLTSTKRKTITKQASRLGKVIEQLEDRLTPATLYAANPGTYTITVDTGAPGLSAGDTVTWNGASPVAGLTFGTNAYSTIQSAVNGAASLDTVQVAAGTYTENVTINKQLTLLGAQTGVDARGRFPGAPNPATESIINPGSGTFVLLISGSANSIINGFSFTGGTGRGIESATGPIDNLQILNNDFRGMANSAVFLNDNGLNITVDKNSFDGASQTGGDLFHLDTDNFNGFYFTNNWLKNRTGGTGFFVDGNHNVGPSVLRTPLISGNLIDNNATGMNLGTRAFGAQFVPNAGTISGNTFSNSGFDGLQGGMQNVLITQNTFTGNDRYGLALTSFGNLNTDRGAQNSVITENFFSGNTGVAPSGDMLFSSSQPAGTISTNKAYNNSFDAIGSAKTILYSGTESINANNNWFGSGVLATVLGSLGGTGTANIDTSPYLTTGTDTSATPGFQGSFADLTVHISGKQIGATTRIQEGVSTVTTGGTVRVTAGSYTGGILVDKTLTVTGVGLPTVTAANLSGQDVGFQIAADNGLLEGFNITGSGFEYGVLFSDKNSGPAYTGGIVQNNQFSNLGYAIATADGAIDYTNAVIQGNTIAVPVGGGWGIYLQSGSGHTVWGNTITGDADGAAILVQGTDGVIIGGTSVGQGNTITGIGSAVIALDATNTSFIGNTVTGMSGVSGAVRLEGGVSGFAINQNSITGGAVPAVRIRQNYSPNPNSGLTINNNDLTGNTYGIQIGTAGLASNLDAQGNNFAGNTSGTIDNADGTYTVNAGSGYFGSTVPATVATKISGPVDYTPFLNSGTDISPAVGFQGNLANITVHKFGSQVGSSGRVQEGVDTVATAGKVFVTAGAAYTDGVVTVSKASLTADVPTGATGFSFLLGGTVTNFSVTGNGAVNITGNASNNVIAGNGGNNTILGADGVDTVVFTGNYADYSFFFTGTGPSQTLTFVDNRVGSPDGTDVLNGVELLQFADGTRRVNPSTLVLSNNTIAENNPIGALVGIFSSDGYQPLPGLVNYTLVTGVGDTGNSKFTISGNQLLAAAKFNYEVTPSYSIRVRAEDTGGLFIESVYTISVLDLDETPPLLALARGNTVEWLDGKGAKVYMTPSIPAAFGKSFNIAAFPDRNGDGVPELIVGSSPIVSNVAVPSLVGLVDGKTGNLLWSTSPYGTFNGGVNVAVGDVTGDGKFEYITAPMAGGGPHVKAFDGVSKALVRSFMAYGANFIGGVNVASGDVNGDGRADIVTAPAKGGGPDVRVFNGMSNPPIVNGISATPTFTNFNAFPTTYTAGVSVSVGDMNGDGYADIMTGAVGGPQVRVFSGFNYSMLLDFVTVSNGLSTQVAFRSFVEDGPVRLVTMTTTSSSFMLTAYDTSLSKVFSTTYSSVAINNPPRRIG